MTTLSDREAREAFEAWYDKRDGIRNAWTAWQAALEWSRRQSAGAQACRAQDKEGSE